MERGGLPRFRDLRVVGQIGYGYILVDEPLAAWIVDQHVAHERALLDRLTDPEDERMPTTQSLLIPEVAELPPQDAAEAADSLEELSVYGFEVEPFGRGSFRINGVISTLSGDASGAPSVFSSEPGEASPDAAAARYASRTSLDASSAYTMARASALEIICFFSHS